MNERGSRSGPRRRRRHAPTVDCSTRCRGRHAARRHRAAAGHRSTPAATWPPPTSATRSVGGSIGFLGRHHGQPVAAQPHHRRPARRPPDRPRAGDEAAPAGVGRRPRAGVGHVDVRPARAAQRLVQHRVLGAEAHEYLVDFYGPIDDSHQRRRRERPPARGLGHRPTAADTGRTAGRRPSPCRRRRHRRAAPHRPAERRGVAASACADELGERARRRRAIVGFSAAATTWCRR